MPSLGNVTPRLPVRNLATTLAFYTGQLGFDAEVLWPEPRPTFAVLCRDAARLGFFEPTEHRTGPVGSAELYIETSDVRRLYQVLRHGVPIEWGPEVYPYGRREFALRDPDGYLVIFTEPTNDPPTTDGPEA